MFSVGEFDLFSFYWDDNLNEKAKNIYKHFFPKNRDYFDLFSDSKDYLSFSEEKPFDYEENNLHDDSEKKKKVLVVKRDLEKKAKIKKEKSQVLSCISDNEANNYVFINCRKIIEVLLNFLIKLDGRFVDIQKIEKLTPGEKLYTKEF